jgi:hypothetical protein
LYDIALSECAGNQTPSPSCIDGSRGDAELPFLIGRKDSQSGAESLTEKLILNHANETVLLWPVGLPFVVDSIDISTVQDRLRQKTAADPCRHACELAGVIQNPGDCIAIIDAWRVLRFVSLRNA